MSGFRLSADPDCTSVGLTCRRWRTAPRASHGQSAARDRAFSEAQYLGALVHRCPPTCRRQALMLAIYYVPTGFTLPLFNALSREMRLPVDIVPPSFLDMVRCSTERDVLPPQAPGDGVWTWFCGVRGSQASAPFLVDRQSSPWGDQASSKHRGLERCRSPAPPQSATTQAPECSDGPSRVRANPRYLRDARQVAA